MGDREQCSSECLDAVSIANLIGRVSEEKLDDVESSLSEAISLLRAVKQIDDVRDALLLQETEVRRNIHEYLGRASERSTK